MSSNGNQASTTNQPSSILFFIAVAIGVLIALVFIFFSMRYYVRTRLGIYATARITSTTNNGGVVLLTGDFPMQTFNAYSAEITNQMRRNRRRRRFTKKRRLTEEEVDHLFPARTYQDWLEGGAERDIEGRDIHEEIKEEDEDGIVEGYENEASGSNGNNSATPVQPITSSDNAATTETINTVTTGADDKSKAVNIEATDSATETAAETAAETVAATTTDSDAHALPSNAGHTDLGDPYREEVHFDSGTCAICIDTFESDDQVRGLICGHVFHQDCLDPWLIKRKACCPMCKRDYYLKKNNDPEEPEEEPDNISFTHYNTELQYTTLSERVTEILARDPTVEERAKRSIEKYLGPLWRVFWFLMGISRSDLINSAIVSEDQRSRNNHNPTAVAPTAPDEAQDNTNNNNPNSNNDTDGNADGENLRTQLTEETAQDLERSRERVERLA